jgi:putative permease
MNIITDWLRRVFSDRQAVVLALLLVIGALVIIGMGKMLAPVIAGVIIAYLLEGLVALLHRQGLPRMPSVVIVFVLFCAFLVFVLLGLAPLLSTQLTQLVQQLPIMLAKGQDLLMRLPELYPRFVSEEQVAQMIGEIRGEMARFGQNVLSWSLASVVGIITIIVYLVLVPLLAFFFLKDRDRILGWFEMFMPSDHSLAYHVWRDVDLQIGNYVRGKFFEICIVWVASYLTFAFLGLQFAVLVGLMVGISVIIPYIGAALATFPVAIIGFAQWGWGPDLFWLMGAYAVLQALDGNVLVPLLFSEVVDLHPIAIIVAVLVFGGVWGFWGVFFAIPLATLVQAVLKAWPTVEPHVAQDSGSAPPVNEERNAA